MINFLMYLSGHDSSGEQLIIEGLTYQNDPGLYSTNTLGHPSAIIGYQYYPIVWTVYDKTFIAWTQRDGVPYNNESMICVYDHFTKKISDSFAWGELNPPNSDIHLMPAIIDNMNNQLLMLEENPHNGPVYPKLSGTNFKISEYTQYSNFGSLLAYPHIHHLNGDLYSIFRRGSADTGAMLYKSTTNGVSWDQIGYIAFIPQVGDDIEWFYPLTPFYNGDKIGLFYNRRRGLIPRSFAGLYYMETSDGINWGNIQGTFSKNITGGNYITTAELDANCLVYEVNNQVPDDEYMIRANAACFVGDNAYCVGGDGTVNPPGNLYYFNGTSWVRKEIIVPGHNILTWFDLFGIYNNITALYYKEGYLYLIANEQVGAYAQMSKFRTADNGDNWEFVEQLSSGNYNFMNSEISANYDNTGRGCYVFLQNTNVDYSDLWIGEL